MPLSPGDKLGHYEILAPLGAGGMGEVYKARDTQLKRHVAIKVLPNAMAHDPERLARFDREAKILAALNHPTIAVIYGLVESEGHSALVMELVPGDTLGSRIKRGLMSPQEACKVARQIAGALEAAHEKGVVHRDVKPGNVMITPAGLVKVLDFGLAAVSQPSAPTDPNSSPTLAMACTVAGTIMGTAAYMSPEQAEGLPVDKRADIWSFGVVLWEMLTGKRLFQGQTLSRTLADVLRMEIDFTKLPQEVPTAMRDLLSRCLERDVNTRLRDIGEARIALDRVLDRAPTDESEDHPVSRRRTVLPWVAAAVLALIAAFASWTAWSSTRAPERPMLRLRVDLGENARISGLTTPAIAPDGTCLVFLSVDATGKRQLATLRLDQSQPTLLPGTENATGPFFSPDSQWIGFEAEGKLKKVPVQGGSVITLCDAPGLRGAAWGDGGYIIATLGSNPGYGLSRVPETGGTPQPLTKPEQTGEATHRWPQILPGGKSVLFTGNAITGNYEGASIQVLSLETGKWKVVQPRGYYGRYLPGGYLVFVREGTLYGVPFDLDRLEVAGTPAPLLEDVAGFPVLGNGGFDFASNGTFVYLPEVAGATASPLAWLDATGKTQPLPVAGSYTSLRLSPDGKQLAAIVSHRPELQVFDLTRGAAMRRQSIAAQGIRAVTWAPDGNHIVLTSLSSAGYTLQWIRADGAGEIQELLTSKSELRGASISRDGRVIYAQASAGTEFDLWMLPLDLSDPEHPKPGKKELFLGSPAWEDQPSISPDGRWVAFESNKLGTFEVYVRPASAEPSSPVQWQVSSGGGSYPVWSRGGSDLFYVANRGIMTVHYSLNSPSFVVDPPRPWSSTPLGSSQFDIAPDGKRLLVALPVQTNGQQTDSAHIVFLLNFFDEVRRRMPVRR
jgi:serine/threonine protein kinase